MPAWRYGLASAARQTTHNRTTKPGDATRMRHTLLALTAAFAALLAYGYWHAATHATLSFSISDASPGARAYSLPGIELRLRDAAGHELAVARSQGPYHVIAIVEPAEFSCAALEQSAFASTTAREAWQACFARQSRWIAGWAGRIAAADLRAGDCRLSRIPLPVTTYNDWWLWWVPLPHVGGKPYALHSIALALDPSKCAVVRR